MILRPDKHEENSMFEQRESFIGFKVVNIHLY